MERRFKLEDLAAAFTEWERRFRETPEQFSADWHAVPAESYGLSAALYLMALLGEPASDFSLVEAWAGEMARNTEKESALASLRAAHAELQHVFLMQGKELTDALAAKAAERK